MHELKPGDPVCLKETGQVGIVAEVQPDQGQAVVWWLEWVARNPPELARLYCALDGLAPLRGAKPVCNVIPGTPQHGVQITCPECGWAGRYFGSNDLEGDVRDCPKCNGKGMVDFHDGKLA